MIDAETLAEKLRPPRALTLLGGSLMAGPAEGSRTAWLAWWDGDPRSLDAVIARARALGATRLTAGGPPGNYVESGVDASDAGRFTAAGFVARGGHVDLRVETTVAARAGAEVEVVRAADELIGLIGERFGAAWAWEATRARSHDGLFAARSREGAWLGFAAHSGNLAHRGTFGPIGVFAEARGTGLGAALTTTVLADLRARGHREATVPWVARETEGFYARLATIIDRRERLVMTRELTRTDWA